MKWSLGKFSGWPRTVAQPTLNSGSSDFSFSRSCSYKHVKPVPLWSFKSLKLHFTHDRVSHFKGTIEAVKLRLWLFTHTGLQPSSSWRCQDKDLFPHRAFIPFHNSWDFKLFCHIEPKPASLSANRKNWNLVGNWAKRHKDCTVSSLVYLQPDAWCTITIFHCRDSLNEHSEEITIEMKKQSTMRS